MKNVILMGRMGSGKTTVAKYLEKEYTYKVVSFADPIKEIASNVFGMKEKDRNLLQMIGKVGRAIKPTIWIEKTLEKIEKDKWYVVDDCRMQNEFDEFVLKHNFIPIFIDAWEQVRVMRCINAGQEVSRKYLDDVSETSFDKIVFNCTFDDKYNKIKTYVILNNETTLDDFYRNIEGVLEKIND